MIDVFPFFVGSGRSGTTLLRAMFNAHPEMAIPFESHFIAPMAMNGRPYQSGDSFDVDLFAGDLDGEWAFKQWDLPVDTVLAAVKAARPRSYADAVREVFALFARVRGKRRYADKTPDYVMSIPLLSHLFPESRFVHIIRDGRDVALALRDTWWGPQTVEQAAIYWSASVEGGRRAGRWLGPERYREIRYEALIADTETVLREVCDFISLEFDPVMLRYYERADEVVASDPDPGEQRHLFLAPTKGLRDWRRQMAQEDIATFELIAGDVLLSLKYEVGHPLESQSGIARSI